MCLGFISDRRSFWRGLFFRIIHLKAIFQHLFDGSGLAVAILLRRLGQLVQALQVVQALPEQQQLAKRDFSGELEFFQRGGGHGAALG